MKIKEVFKNLFARRVKREAPKAKFPSIEQQLSTQDEEGPRFFFTPDGEMHMIPKSLRK